MRFRFFALQSSAWVLGLHLAIWPVVSSAGPIADAIKARQEQRRAAQQEQGEDGASELEGRGSDTATKGSVPGGTRVERDLSYGPDEAHKLDLYRPATAKAAPIIFMVHGGAWMVGKKDASKVITNKLAYWLPKGYMLVSINYRMSFSPKVLDEVDDVARALAFVQSKAASWGGDPARILVMGHSAGAHLVSMITSDPRLAQAHGASAWLGTISLDSAAFNVVQTMEEKHYRFYDRVFGKDASFWAQTSPYHRLTARPLAPMMLVCSTKRSDSCPQAQAYAEKANGLGGRVTVLPVDLAHGDVNGNLGGASDYTRTVDTFVRGLGLP